MAPKIGGPNRWNCERYFTKKKDLCIWHGVKVLGGEIILDYPVSSKPNPNCPYERKTEGI